MTRLKIPELTFGVGALVSGRKGVCELIGITVHGSAFGRLEDSEPKREARLTRLTPRQTLASD